MVFLQIIYNNLLISDKSASYQSKSPESTVLTGFTPDTGRTFSGPKIAFTRIPDREDFKE